MNVICVHLSKLLNEPHTHNGESSQRKERERVPDRKSDTQQRAGQRKRSRRRDKPGFVRVEWIQHRRCLQSSERRLTSGGCLVIHSPPQNPMRQLGSHFKAGLNAQSWADPVRPTCTRRVAMHHSRGIRHLMRPTGSLVMLVDGQRPATRD